MYRVCVCARVCVCVRVVWLPWRRRSEERDRQQQRFIHSERSANMSSSAGPVVMVTCLPTSPDVTSCAEAGGRENTSEWPSRIRATEINLLSSHTHTQNNAVNHSECVSPSLGQKQIEREGRCMNLFQRWDLHFGSLSQSFGRICYYWNNFAIFFEKKVRHLQQINLGSFLN